MADAFTTFGDDAIGDLDTVGLIEALASGGVSPTELRDASLARANAARVPLNAVVTMVDDPAIASGPFNGIPTFVKDNEDIAGLPTSHGSRATSRNPKTVTSAFAEQYQRLGFTVLGKSTLPEFGLTATTEPLATGPTRNPWNPDHSSGGSSGGSASLVAAGVVPIAHANDGGGSIRIPAACCGLVGLKPSRGRLISAPELERMPVAIAVQGVVTRTVRDTAAFYREIERLHPTLAPIGNVVGPGRQRLRIAVVDEGMAGLPVDPEVQATVRHTADLCSDLGHDVEFIPFPFDEQFGRDFLRYWAGVAFAIQVGGKQAFDPEFDKTKLEPFTYELSGLFKHIAVRMPAALRRLRAFPATYAAAFVDFDVMLSPVLSHPAPEIGYLGAEADPHDHLVRLLRYASFTAIHNVSGAPAISLPIGESASGLPIGVQAAAPYGHEANLLELAYELESAAHMSTTAPTRSWFGATSGS